jgi:alginate O-acetyltransferase complex protein AlgJ
MEQIRFFIKLVLFIAPFAIAIFVELFILPLDFFAFRIWEAIRMRSQTITGMPFYPNMRISKKEVGDCAPYTQWAVEKDALWVTDQYGFRKEKSGKTPIIMIIGDSEMAGTSLTQSDIFSESFERLTQLVCYPYAPEFVGWFIQDPRFIKAPSRLVIYEIVERDIRSIIPLAAWEHLNIKGRLVRLVRPYLSNWLVYGTFSQKVIVLADRISKQNMFWFLRAESERQLKKFLRIDETVPKARLGKPRCDGSRMVFMQGMVAMKPIPTGILNKSISIIKAYQNYFNERNIRFVFLPIPNKETVYYRDVPGCSGRPAFLDSLIAAARREGIETVDLASAYDSVLSLDKDRLFFHLDDTHWNREGVSIAAQVTMRIIGKYLPLAADTIR